MEKSKRLLPETMVSKVKNFPETMRDGHVVNVILKDGRKVPNVFIFRSEEVLGIYDVEKPSFEVQDIADLELVKEFPAYDESKWLRLDGRAS